MEEISRPHSLKKDFMLAVAFTLLVVVLASTATICGCYRVQKYVLPDSNDVWLYAKTTLPDGTVSEVKQAFTLHRASELFNLLPSDALQPAVGETEYTIERIEYSFSSLTPHRKILYQVMGIFMVALPLLYSVAGTGMCAWWFYRKKLAPPIRILNDAAAHISSQDLDFKVTCQSKDELGQLCAAFEKMRQALYENNQQLWRIIEERRTLQASIAHDLRNPITILSGYIEYMQMNIPSGKLTGEKLQHTLSNLAITTKRMERYTDYIRDLHAMEETQVTYAQVLLPDFLKGAADTLAVWAGSGGIHVACEYSVPDCVVCLDGAIFYRILENMFSNAIRFAECTIHVSFQFRDMILSATVQDDGRGFSKQMLQKEACLFYSEDTTGEHMGLGLATSKVLCQKHGGRMELRNIMPHGACVTAFLKVK